MKRTILLNRQDVLSKLMSLYGKDRNLLSDQIRDFIRKWFRCKWWGGEGNLFHFYRTFVISGLRRKRRIFTIILAEFCEGEYDVVGKILYHIFISFAFFSVQFYEISLQNTFIGQYPDWFVPKIYITQWQLSLFWCVDAKQIWLWTYYRANPTKDHIRNLIIKAAKIGLISKPSPAFRSFKDFRIFFKNFTGNHISSIYELSKPTDTKILQYWYIPVPSDQHGESTFDYLNRYIDESDK